MRINLRQCVLVLAVAMGICVTGGTLGAAASALPQDQAHVSQNPDYSKNKTYQQGLKEGRGDQAHNLDHSKKRHFKKDEDRNAYEAGYQQGHQGDQPK
jgi:hypothetical protein